MYNKRGFTLRESIAKLADSNFINKVVLAIASIGLVGLISYGAVAAHDSGSVSGTGYGTNNTNITVISNTNQTATSGDATVSGNTTGGNATSGNASNSNTTTINITVSNF